MLKKMIYTIGALFSIYLISYCSKSYKTYKSTNYIQYSYNSKEYNGKIWMTENLKEITDSNGHKIKFSYPNNDSTKYIEYGLLYDYKTACKVCPKGWHLPTDKEWDSLIEFTGKKKGNDLKDSSYWNSSELKFSNIIGFSVRPAGYSNTGEFENLFSTHAIFWSVTKVDTHFVNGFVLSQSADSIRKAPQHPVYGFSVRCVKN